jgi:hypothetical protein
MNKLMVLNILVVILATSCTRSNFKYVTNTSFNDKVTIDYSEDHLQLFDLEDTLENSRYYLGIIMQDTFLGGELTFTQKTDYTFHKASIQYCYILFDDSGNVFYNTYAVEQLQDSLEISIPYTVGLDTLSMSDAPDALQGKYYVQGDTLRMIMESKEQDELVELQAIVINKELGAFEIFSVTRKRLTFSPLQSIKEVRTNQKVFNLDQVFSIDLLFKKIYSKEGIVHIHRDATEKKSLFHRLRGS